MSSAVHVVADLREFPDGEGFWGPVIERDGSLYVVLVLFGWPGAREDRPPVVELEALTSDGWMRLPSGHTGGSLEPERFAGYGIWHVPVEKVADYRVGVSARG